MVMDIAIMESILYNLIKILCPVLKIKYQNITCDYVFSLKYKSEIKGLAMCTVQPVEFNENNVNTVHINERQS